MGDPEADSRAHARLPVDVDAVVGGFLISSIAYNRRRLKADWLRSVDESCEGWSLPLRRDGHGFESGGSKSGRDSRKSSRLEGKSGTSQQSGTNRHLQPHVSGLHDVQTMLADDIPCS